MTLSELSDNLFTTPGQADNVTAVVFDNENCADAWMDDKLNGNDNGLGGIICVLCSDMCCRSYLKDDICQKNVEQIYAVGRDQFVVVIEEV